MTYKSPTTATVQEDLYTRLFDALPGNNVFIQADAPRYTILAATESYLQVTGKSREQLIGRSMLEAFPSNPDHPTHTEAGELIASFEKVIRDKKEHQLPVQRYDVSGEDGKFKERFWRITNTPVADKEGNVAYIINASEDITDSIKAQQREENRRSIELAQTVLTKAPLAIHILKGPDLIIELANEPTIELWSRGADVLGKPVLEVLPELKTQKFIDIINEVRETGKPYQAFESPIILLRGGKEKEVFFNLDLQPYYEEDKTKATGVVVYAKNVTDLVASKMKVAQKEMSLELAIEIGELGIFCVNLKSNTATYSQHIMDWFGFEEQHFPMEEVLSKIYPDDQLLVKEILERSKASDNTGRHDFTYRVLHPKTGALQYLHSIGQVLFVDDIPTSVTGIIRNVTSEFTSRKAVEESEAKYHSLFEKMDQGFCIIEMIFDAGNKPLDYRFLETNPVFEKQTGLKNSVGKTALEIVPTLEGHWFQLYGKVALSGESVHFVEETEIMDRIFEVYAYRIGDSDSRKVALLFTNITERKKSEDALRESEKRFRNMILQAPVAMCILKEPNHIVEIANDRQLEIWGKTRIDVMNKPVFEGVPETKGQGHEEILHKVFTTGESFSEYGVPVVMMRNGKLETVYLSYVAEAYKDVDGTILGIMTVATDVTEQVLARHKIEQKVAERTKELAEANNALNKTNAELSRSNVNLEEFAYAASHDLKEPIRKIHFFTDRLKHNLSERLNEEEKLFFERMERAAKRMSSLIDDLLSYSQVSLRPKILEDVNLNEIINLVINDLDFEIEGKGATIQVDVLFTIQGHHRQLQQAFQNLLSNSLKYSTPGVPLYIKISSQKIKGEEMQFHNHHADIGREYYVISIADNGIGFEQKDAVRIFNIFTRLHGNAEFKGTGVGLSIVQKIIGNHNGIVIAESEPGKGATFKVYLPVNH